MDGACGQEWGFVGWLEVVAVAGGGFVAFLDHHELFDFAN